MDIPRYNEAVLTEWAKDDLVANLERRTGDEKCAGTFPVYCSYLLITGKLSTAAGISSLARVEGQKFAENVLWETLLSTLQICADLGMNPGIGIYRKMEGGK